MIRAVKFHPSHLDLVNPTEVFQGETNRKIADLEPDEEAYTLMLKDRIVGCVGAMPLKNDGFYIWSIFTTAIYEEPHTFARFISDFLEKNEREKKIKYTRTCMKVGYTFLDRWARFLKFKRVRKITLEGHGDYYLMQRIPNV